MTDNKRYRGFCCVSYLNEEQIKSVLYKHDKQIRAYAYILHDKDIEQGKPKEKHFHILLQLVHATTPNAIRNWFAGYVDNKDMPINTLSQPMHDISSSFVYLTHSDENSIQAGKYQYDISLVKSNNIEFFKDSKGIEEDNISLAIQDLMNGIPLHEVATKYGRDFIIHYQSIKLLYNDIQKQLGGLPL